MACVFCKIVEGTVPSLRVLENEHVLAFLDINPLAPGHLLVIPKRHFERLDQMPEELTAEIARMLPKLGRAVATAAGAMGYNLLQNNGACAGQVVEHVHFHLIPRVPGDGLGYRWPAGKYPPGKDQEMLGKMTAALR